MEKTNEQQVEAARELARLLGLSEQRIITLLGTKVKGTAEFSQTGDFHFCPQKETGPRLEQIKKTRAGSTLTKTLHEQSRLRMTLYSTPGSIDPEADIIAEANQLLSTMGSKKRIKLTGRTIADTDRVRIRADTSTASLNIMITVPMVKGADYTTAIANEIGTALKAVARNKDKIRKLEPKTTKDND